MTLSRSSRCGAVPPSSLNRLGYVVRLIRSLLRLGWETLLLRLVLRRRTAIDILHQLRAENLGKLDITGSHDLGYFSWKFPDITNFRWQGCRAGIDTLGIHSNGDVKGCLILPDRFIEGNVRETPIAQLWRDPDRFSLIRKFDESMLEGNCRECPFGAVCKGGCKDIAYSMTGSPYDFPYCLRKA